jgi:hypothetical protein
MEFGALRRMPAVLTSYYLLTLSQHLLKLCESMCANEPYVCKQLLYRLQTRGTGKDNVAKLTYNKHSISFKLTELNYLLAAITTFENQLARYTVAQNDVMSYVTTALGAQQYVRPRPDASTCFV